MDIRALIENAENELTPVFQKLDRIEQTNTEKVLRAFQKYRVSSRHFAPTTGYGYDDIGRDTLSEIIADVFGCESALMRPQIASGTHALALCLYGILRPGDTLLSAAGKPYDTLEEVIGLAGTPGNGSLKDYGIGYKQVDLQNGKLNKEGIAASLSPDVKLVLIQRSRGYDWRPSLNVEEIDEVVRFVHEKLPSAYVMVDNCYGEFTREKEPSADILAGSLIKNPGGGMAPTGGYIAGKKECLEKIAYRLTSPGIGAEVGSYAGSYQPFYQGFFMAPHTVGQALRVSALFACVFEKLGYAVHPRFDDVRGDIIQAIRFENPDLLIRFIQSIQADSPVDSEAVPEPWDMPGYQDPVIMAAGTFVSGASIELSADAPIRPPYIAYLQGGLTYAHGKIALEGALERMMNH